MKHVTAIGVAVLAAGTAGSAVAASDGRDILIEESLAADRIGGDVIPEWPDLPDSGDDVGPDAFLFEAEAHFTWNGHTGGDVIRTDRDRRPRTLTRGGLFGTGILGGLFGGGAAAETGEPSAPMEAEAEAETEAAGAAAETASDE